MLGRLVAGPLARRPLAETLRDRTVRISITITTLVLLLLVGEQMYTAIVTFSPTDIALSALAALAIIIFLIILTIFRSLTLAWQASMVVALVYFFIDESVNGNFHNNLIFTAMLPVFSIVILGPRRSLKWFGAFVLLLLSFATSELYLPYVSMEQLNEYLPRPIYGQHDYLFHMWWKKPLDIRGIAYFGVMLTLIYGILYALFSQLEAAQTTIENLLMNVLPKSIVARLRDRPASDLKGSRLILADDFQAVSILFADIVGFTALSGTLTPQQTVELLNTVFIAFDNLAEKHGVEKLKTIGDAYMAVAGLPLPQADHAERIAELALDMLAAMAGFGDRFDAPLEIRIGINTGAVVAGIIGRSKFIYDIWGDAVNVASRMESNSRPGAIQATAEMKAALQDKYCFASRGRISVKGKGDLETWWLEGRLTQA